MMHNKDKANHLIRESSPYLLQHAYNPVDWYPWGEDALEKAKKENKLLIISIGYSACHWCHVMEHESFEDSLVAEVMNDSFVSIKVDREERPDIDDIYMTACNLITGGGGWPLNAIALPDGRPIWAGTYFPKERWIQILKQISKMYRDNPAKLDETAERLISGLKQVDLVEDVNDKVDFSALELEKILEQFLSNIDYEFGGRNGSPKFPMPNNYEFLLKCAFVYKDSRVLEAVETTLKKMGNGGIYDHIGGGFARYSVDPYWKVPHFEKMLYDNAQLLSLYAKAFQFTGDSYYLAKLKETAEFMRKEWKHESGAYYSAYDADSEGVEGKYYVWDWDELSELIDNDEEFEMFIDYYSIRKNGNWEGSNILYTVYNDDEFISKYGLDTESFKDLKGHWAKKLGSIRDQRIKPGLDDKILCSWNALLMNGFIDAYKATGDSEYKRSALDLWTFIQKELKSNTDYRLDRNFKAGKSSINGFLDDYASLIQALLNLYSITFDEQILLEANAFTEYVIEHFSQEDSEMFYYTSDIDPPLVARKSELSDNVIPGSNSMMARNLYYLGLYLYHNQYIERSKQMLRNMKSSIINSRQPNFYSNWCNLFFDFIYPPYEIAIVGNDYEAKLNKLSKYYHPNALLLGGVKEGNLELLSNKLQVGETFIYVCKNKTCKLPVKDPELAYEMMTIAIN